MSFLPAALGGKTLMAWRLDQASFAPTWDSGEGAYRVGGRWNSRGTRAIYCSLDPATAVLEVAVHKGFRALDTIPHVLTGAEIRDRSAIHIVRAENLPDPAWLRPGIPSAAQQAFGDDLLGRHQFVALPSAVSPHSWNLVFVSTGDGLDYEMRLQEQFILDPRLHPDPLERR